MKTFFLFLVASTAVLSAPVDKKTEELTEKILPRLWTLVHRKCRTGKSSNDDIAAAEYRNSSALLPGERVEYINTFKKENGKWKLLLIVSEMKLIKKEKAEAQ